MKLTRFNVSEPSEKPGVITLRLDTAAPLGSGGCAWFELTPAQALELSGRLETVAQEISERSRNPEAASHAVEG